MTVASAWDEGRGRNSRAFHEWRLVEQDIRTFLRLGVAFATAEYDRLWSESGEEPYIEEGPDHLESFEAKVDGLHEHDYCWMHRASVVRDAVTCFEVYLEKAREEVLDHHGQEIPVALRSPTWRRLVDFLLLLGIKVETAAVVNARDLRHFLTHRRGELRSEELRTKFQAETSDGFPAWTVELTDDRVLTVLDDLASTVIAIDPGIYAHTWGGVRIPTLVP